MSPQMVAHRRTAERGWRFNFSDVLSGRRHWPIRWCCPDRGSRSFDVEDATTLSWSSAAVS